MNAYDYDPFSRGERIEEQRLLAARAEHEQWSLEQSRLGQSATQRDGAVWVKRLPDVPEGRS
jgi:hypothetical protein